MKKYEPFNIKLSHLQMACQDPHKKSEFVLSPVKFGVGGKVLHEPE